MTKSRSHTPKQIAAAKNRAIGQAIIKGARLSDPRAQSVMDLIRDLRAWKDPRSVALAKALGSLGIHDILMLIDRIAPKPAGGQKRPNINDGMLLVEMIDRVENGEVPERVAYDLAKKADGSGTLDSKASRLKVGYRKIWKSNNGITPKT